MMSQLYLNILSDLLETDPLNPMVMPDPYDRRKSLRSNVRSFYRNMRWSLRVNDRVGSLVTAYYLGKLLEERASTPHERRQCGKLLTDHYVLACTRVYNLFIIGGIQQIYRSQRCSYWMFRRISKREYCDLLNQAQTLI